MEGSPCKAAARKPLLRIATQIGVARFKKHKLACISLVVLAILYFVSIFADFFAPFGPLERFKDFNDAPPTSIHFINADGKLSRPCIYETKRVLNTDTFKYEYSWIRQRYISSGSL